MRFISWPSAYENVFIYAANRGFLYFQPYRFEDENEEDSFTEASYRQLLNDIVWLIFCLATVCLN